ncbi:hypothetical protein TNCV_1425521 [Trichonephila clavipes]|nr:hypothetical protein TNCV_1425521 [Trichonephila clavipes]
MRRKEIPIQIVDNESYERDSVFYVELGDPRTEEAARGLLTKDHVILNHDQVTWMTPELAPLSPNYHSTPTGKRFNSQQI